MFETPLVESEEDRQVPGKYFRGIVLTIEYVLKSLHLVLPSTSFAVTCAKKSAGVQNRGCLFFVHTFLKLHYWILILEVSHTSTLITGVSSLIPSSSRIPTLLGHGANLLAILALYSTLSIVGAFKILDDRVLMLSLRTYKIELILSTLCLRRDDLVMNVLCSVRRF
ncbi:hypothetical protein Tco_1291986 [Tanacetum coccineum]